MIGEHSYITTFETPSSECPKWVEIGRFSQIASNVHFVGDEHPSVINKRIVANFPFANKWAIVDYPVCQSKGLIIVENDVWIGKNSTVLAGIRIKSGAIVGAGSVVTKDVPPYAIVVGNPAVIVGYRFSPKIIKSLLKIRWWNWEENQVRDALEDMKDIYKFIQKYA